MYKYLYVYMYIYTSTFFLCIYMWTPARMQCLHICMVARVHKNRGARKKPLQRWFKPTLLKIAGDVASIDFNLFLLNPISC